MRTVKLAGFAVILLLGMTAAAQGVSLEFNGASFKVSGWQVPATPPARGWPSIFVVYAGTGDVPPLAGSYAVESGSLVFHPTFPIAPGVRYRAIFRSPAGGQPIEKSFDGPRRDATPVARVTQVYPSGDILPSNQLRLYIYFSAPMSRGEASARIHFLDESGKPLENIFLPAEELWDPRFERLTMTFDPGRIKRGLTSNIKVGPPITEGKRYTLVIDRSWPDARGVPMLEGFRKDFRGGPAERNPPDPREWRIVAPKTGTTGAVAVDFPVPMNYPLLQRMLTVLGEDGSAVAGTVRIERQETQWRFTPEQPWKAGGYRLVVDTALEDGAGNHIGQPFDIDVFEKVTERITRKTISLAFTVQ